MTESEEAPSNLELYSSYDLYLPYPILSLLVVILESVILCAWYSNLLPPRRICTLRRRSGETATGIHYYTIIKVGL